jgi:metal-responsive CopG/Arc/MetJ family transcriptional regulator
LRLEGEVVDKLDEAWRSRGIKNRTEFFRGAWLDGVLERKCRSPTTG